MATVYPVATWTVYPTETTNLNDPSAEITTFKYTWFPNTNRVQSQTTTWPTVSTAHNGPGTPDVDSAFFDVYGRPIWTKDADGYINYTEYDAKGSGAVTKSIVDVDTTKTGDFNSATLPQGWVTPTGGGLHLKTLYQADGLGRTTILTDPNGNVTYTVYLDTYHEVRTYPGWQSSTNTTTGPTLVTREDYSNSTSYVERLTVTTMPSTSSGVPTGLENINPQTNVESYQTSDIQSLSRSYVSAGGQLIRTDDYSSLAGMTWSTNLYIGTAGTNYYSTLYGYDVDGRENHTVSPTGTITVTDYDGLGRVTDVKVGTTDANLTLVNQYQYDDNVTTQMTGDSNLAVEMDYPGGGAATRKTQNFYDWRDRLVESKQGGGTETDGTHRPIFYTQYDNLDEVVSSEQYDGDGFTTFTSTNGVPDRPPIGLLRAKTTTAYDEQGRVYQTNVYSVDPINGPSMNTLNTNIWYDRRGDLIKTSEPGGLVTKTVTDGAGRVTNLYETDGAGDSTWSDANKVTNNNVLSETDTQYDGDGNVIFVIDKERFHNETATGALGSPGTSPLARESYLASYYDAANRLTTSVDLGTNGGTVLSGRPTSAPVRSSPVLRTDYAYNPAGMVQTITDAKGMQSQTTYDLLGRTTQTVDAYTGGTPGNSTDRTTQYTYDGDGHVLTLTALLPGGSETTQYTYGVTTATSGVNSNDLLARVTYPGQAATERYTYDALGEVTGYTDRNGNAHTYFYDVLGRQTSDQVTILGSNVDGTVQRLDTAYDRAGRPYLFTSYADTAGTTVRNQVQRTFNGLGQLTSESQSHSGPVTASTPSVQYAYSFVPTAGGPNHSRPVSITYPKDSVSYPNGRTITYNYAPGLDDSISRLTSISDSSATLEAYAYLGLDTVVQRSHPQNGVNQTYITPGGNPDGGDPYTGLDRFGRVVEQRWVNTTTNTNTDDFTYSYDQNGNVLTRNNALNSNFNEQYNYDNLNRLTSFARGTHTQSWTLDALGNWTTFMNDGVAQNRTHNSQNQITAFSNLTVQPGYDNNGNMTTDDGGTFYTFDAWNRPVKAVVPTMPSSTTETYSYDALGRRITASVNGATPTDLYYSAAWQVIEEQVSGAMTNQYVWSPVYVDALVERDTSTGQRLYVQQDANWNVTAVVDASGNVQERYVYDPYGKPGFYDQNWNSRTSSLFSWIYLHQGGRYDNATGLYNFRNRDYSPSLGRWIQQDPIGYAAGDSNLYGYEGSTPTDGIDPSGEIAWWLLLIAAGLAVPLGPDYVQAPTSPTERPFPANPMAATIGGSVRGTTAVLLPFSRPVQVAGAALFTYDYADQEAAQLQNWLNGRPVRTYSWSRGFDTVLTFGLSGPFFNSYPALYGSALGLGMQSAQYHAERGEYAQMGVDVAAVTGGLHALHKPAFNHIIVYTDKGPIPLSELVPGLKSPGSADVCPINGPGVRVFTTTDFPVELGRPGTGATGPGGVPISKGIGGTFVTTTDISNPRALDLHIQRNVPPGGTMPRYVTELQANPGAILVDPTEARPMLQNGWIAPNTPGVSVGRVWEIVWVDDPRGFSVPTLKEVPR